MTPLLLAVVLLLATRLSVAMSCAAGVATLVVQRAPALSIPLGAAWLAIRAGRFRRSRRAALTATGQDVAALSELTSIALTGGLGIRRALELAGTTVGGPVGDEVCSVLDQLRIDGSVALTTADGLAVPLYRALGRAALSGAPLLGSVTRLTEQLRSDEAAAREEAVRRLPILMLFPLTLLILPGFVLLAVAPALLEVFGRLEI